MSINNSINVGVVAGGGQTYTFPAATDTLVGRASTDTLTNKTIALGSNTVSGTKAQFNTAVSDGDIVFLDSTDTITGAKTMTGLNSVLVSSSGLTVRNPANTFKYTVTGAAIAADRILNLPLITATDTLASLGLAQTWTATQTFTTPVLGTPTSGTLTNCTGLPIAGLVASTSTALGVGSIELGHASDTTITRVSAGVAAIEGKNILTTDGGTLTGNIVLGENTSIDLDPAGSADGKYSGICITGTAGAALAFGDLCYLAAADSRWELTDADASATGGPVLIGMCVLAAAGDGSATKILLQGQIRADAKFPALTVGAPVYLGETAGAIQTTIPTGVDNVLRVVGFALTADEIYFNPSQDHQITVA